MEITKSEIRQNDWREKAVKGRIYIFTSGENILENLQNRRTRPHKEYRSILSDALQLGGMNKNDADIVAKTASWSQKAGCRCGCSPGFIDNFGTLNHKSVFINIKY